ncbi:MAG: porin [Saprospiraceae bacterium]|nr:porin [Saprospiraceae bacterium]MBP7699273.1 porin [Saprospiraceae bacterium]
MVKKICFLLQLIPILCNAQFGQKNIHFSGYIEPYYSYDFTGNKENQKPNFLYNHVRNNEFNINLMLAKAQYNDSTFRVNIALMAGNYAANNLAAEPTWAQFIYEANIGIKLSKKHNLWADVGIMPSHIGFESAIGTDCWTLTRSIAAENSPYYEAGLKLNYTSKNGEWYVAGMLLNGWQTIQKPLHTTPIAGGIQVTFIPTPNFTINYSNYVGKDYQYDGQPLRIFHNGYLSFAPSKKLKILAGFDFGTIKFHEGYYIWYSPILQVRYAFSKRFSTTLRSEIYNDKYGVIIQRPSNLPFSALGFSTNVDYAVRENVLFRVELKQLNYDNAIDIHNTKQDLFFTTSLSVKL